MKPKVNYINIFNYLFNILELTQKCIMEYTVKNTSRMNDKNIFILSYGYRNFSYSHLKVDLF